MSAPGRCSSVRQTDDVGSQVVRPTRRSREGDYSHCRCGARWSGHAACHCGACHRSFSGLRPFDRHQRQDGEIITCIDPSDAGLVERDGIWRGATPRPRYWSDDAGSLDVVTLLWGVLALLCSGIALALVIPAAAAHGAVALTLASAVAGAAAGAAGVGIALGRWLR